MEQWQQSRCSDTAIYYHIYVLIYHLQDKYCYYSLHVSAHLAYGSLLGWQGILARLMKLISHYPVDKWIDNTMVSGECVCR